MKAANYFWGSFFIFAGLIFLLSNLDIFDPDMRGVWRFWPVLLILMGISFLDLPKALKAFLSSFSGIVAAIVLFSLFSYPRQWFDDECNYDLNFNCNSSNDYEYESLNIDSVSLLLPEGTTSTKLYFAGSAGEFEFSGGTEDWIYVEAPKSIYNLESLLNVGVAEHELHFDYDKHGKIKHLSNSRFANILLNESIIWKFDIDVGACELDMDLRKLKTESVDIDAGAADIRLRIGQLQDSCIVNVGTGVANTVIDVPKNVVCEIDCDVELSGKDFNGFSGTGDGYYRSTDYEKFKKVVKIRLDGGVSNFEINRI